MYEAWNITLDRLILHAATVVDGLDAWTYPFTCAADVGSRVCRFCAHSPCVNQCTGRYAHCYSTIYIVPTTNWTRSGSPLLRGMASPNAIRSRCWWQTQGFCARTEDFYKTHDEKRQEVATHEKLVGTKMPHTEPTILGNESVWSFCALSSLHKEVNA